MALLVHAGAVCEADLHGGRGVGGLGREDRANTATEARSNLRMEYPFRFKLSNQFTDAVLEEVDMVG